jgi:hypothetical protein
MTFTDQDGATTRPLTGFYVAPTVADHEATRKVHAEPFSGTQYHPRFRFAAVALRVVIVLADLYRVERQDGGKLRIYLVDIGAIRCSARDIGLVGHDNQQKALAFQFLKGCADAICEDQFTQIARRIGFAIPDDCLVHYTVAIEEDGQVGASNRQTVPSHFV